MDNGEIYIIQTRTSEMQFWNEVFVCVRVRVLDCTYECVWKRKESIDGNRRSVCVILMASFWLEQFYNEKVSSLIKGNDIAMLTA